MSRKRDINYLSSEKLDADISIGTPPNTAGGMTAVASAMKISLEQMGVGRTLRTLLSINQKRGFDCPGCAWPDPDDRRSMVEFCENGAKAVAEEATRARITPEFFAKHSVMDLSRQTDFWLSQQGRLTEPMFLADGDDHYRPISWDEAFQLIAKELKSLSSPNEAAFYTSGRTSNEAAFLYQLFVRRFGTNNLPDCSNLCHETSGMALTRTIGSGKGTVTLEDFDHSDCIVIIGQNPGTNHPRMLTTLQSAARRGAKIISINPLAETGLKQFKHPQEIRGILGRGTPLATHFVPVSINGDVALLKGIQKVILEDHPDRVDHRFIGTYTEGFDSYKADIKQESWEKIERGSGISRNKIRELAEVISASKSMIICWAMGLTQHENGLDNIEEIVNLLLLGGHFGRPGAGACPVRGHSNVQGDRTMGIWERPSKEFLSRLGQAFDFQPPEKPGYDVVEVIGAMHKGLVKVFFAMGGNFLSASPDTAYTASALQNCSLTVQVSTKLNRSHLVTGRQALILPCLGRTEVDNQAEGPQFVTVENSMGIVHTSEGSLPPASKKLRSEPAIIAGLAKACLDLNWDSYIANYDRIRDLIASTIQGFEKFNERVRRPGGFSLPHAVRDQRLFATASSKALFTSHKIPIRDLKPGQFVMMTIRTHDQYNTTIYGMDDRYRGIHNGRRVILMNLHDMETSDIKADDIVNILSHHRNQTRVAKNFRVVPYEIPRGSVATYFPETNVLVPIDQFAKGSQTPASKSVIVSLAKESN